MQKLLLLLMGAPTLHLAVRPRIVRVGGTTSFSSVRVSNTRFRSRRANILLFLLRSSPPFVLVRSAASIAVAVVISAVGNRKEHVAHSRLT